MAGYGLMKLKNDFDLMQSDAAMLEKVNRR